MFTESAESYDLIHSSFKEYGAEATQIATLLRGSIRVAKQCWTSPAARAHTSDVQ
jgi:hypothetical protein